MELLQRRHITLDSILQFLEAISKCRFDDDFEKTIVLDVEYFNDCLCEKEKCRYCKEEQTEYPFDDKCGTRITIKNILSDREFTYTPSDVHNLKWHYDKIHDKENLDLLIGNVIGMFKLEHKKHFKLLTMDYIRGCSKPRDEKNKTLARKRERSRKQQGQE